MKNMKKILSFALVVVSVLAIALPALAAGYDAYLGPGTSSAYNIRHGQNNARVYNLQTMLVYAGYNPGSVDGIFGDQTDSAVRRFQRTYGLTVDGIVGKDTKECLYMALGETIPSSCVYVDPYTPSDNLDEWN